MFDGFPPAMLDATSTPNFDRIKREGVWSRHLIPAYPTLSMTNHATFVTGCWPAHHGIISNIFFDPVRGRYDNNHHPDNSDWRTGCETMWQAAERQGVHAAVFNFVDRWSGTKGKLATTVNPEVPWKDHESEDTVLARGLAALRDSGPDHPRLIALYFPDSRRRRAYERHDRAQDRSRRPPLRRHHRQADGRYSRAPARARRHARRSAPITA